MTTYDYCIIGAGPSGLTTAYILGKLGYKCILIDSNDSIGGCHRVLRVDGLFTEHSPRIYSSAYLNTMTILKDMGSTWNEIFAPYNFPILGQKNMFKTRELFAFMFEYLNFLIYPSRTRKINMLKFVENNNFSQSSKHYVDRICRLTDGAGYENYSLYEFLQIFNQQILYGLYQPRKPNDKGLLKVFEQSLENTGVKIQLNSKVVGFKTDSENELESIILSDNNAIKAKTYIFAIPPVNLFELGLDVSREFAYDNNYVNDIAVTFHWNISLDLPDIWGFPDTEWGVVYIILSNYMSFEDERSKTVISVNITYLDKKSNYISKTANECDKNDLIKEIFRQLSLGLKGIPTPTYSVLNPKVFKNDSGWMNGDNAYVRTYKDQKIGYQSTKYKNCFNVGTHNGNSFYAFTSFESAVQNAMKLCHQLDKVSKVRYPVIKLFSISDGVSKLVFVFIILLILFLLYRCRCRCR